MNTMEEKQSSRSQRSNVPVRLKYDMTSALYANQFIVNTGSSEIFIEFSSGAIPDPQTGQTVVPIHTRVALTSENAKRLADLLQKAADKKA